LTSNFVEVFANNITYMLIDKLRILFSKRLTDEVQLSLNLAYVKIKPKNVKICMK